MRSRSSKLGKEVEKPKPKEEPHLSGAYIRSLVKQLTSSKAKETMDPEIPIGENRDGLSPNSPKLSEATKFCEGVGPNQPQPQQPKKQIRRRLHTSRPYQERLLNMAEARREIVTALKYHRAAMKQANEQQQQPQSPAPPCLDPLEKMKSRKSPRIYPSTDGTHNANFSNYPNNFSYPSLSAPQHFTWDSLPIAPPPMSDNFNINLPHQPLGLTLNFHDFGNIDTFYHNNNSNPSIYLTSSSSTSSSSPSSSTTTSWLSPTYTEVPSILNVFSPPSSASHHAMDDEEMAEIRSVGEQHEMEWNDRMNLVTSAWWFKFLKTMEISPETHEEMGDEDGFHVFNEMDIPAWLNDGAVGNASESFFLQQQLDDLPCLDIGEIEGMDCEWLA